MSSINDQIDKASHPSKFSVFKNKGIFLTLYNLTFLSVVLILFSSIFTYLLLSPTFNQAKNNTENYKDYSISETVIRNHNEVNFKDIPSYFQVKERSLDITPTESFKIVNSIMSNNRDRVVYSELKLCTEPFEDTQKNIPCVAKYNIFVKNLSDGLVSKIKSGFEESGSSANGSQAGFIDIPIFWTKNDKKIITEAVRVGGVSSEGGALPSIRYFSLDPTSKSLESLVRNYFSVVGTAQFYDSNSKVIYVDSSNSLPQECGYGIGIKNFGRLIFKEIETGQILKELEKTNIAYRLGNVDYSTGNYTYYTQMYEPEKIRKDLGGCMEGPSFYGGSDANIKIEVVELP